MKNQIVKTKKTPYINVTVRVMLNRKLYKRLGEHMGKIWIDRIGETEPEDYYDYMADEIEKNIHSKSSLQAAMLAASLMTFGNSEIVKVSPIKGKKRSKTKQ